MNETYVTIRGRLVADPTVRTTKTGSPMATFRVATSARKPVQGQPGVWEDTPTSFYSVTTFRALAAHVGVSLRKGQPVTIHGRQHITSYVREDGTTWWDVEIVADAAGHDLTYGTAAFAKVGRPGEVEGAAARPESIADEPVGDDGEDTYLNGGPLVVPADECAA